MAKNESKCAPTCRVSAFRLKVRSIVGILALSSRTLGVWNAAYEITGTAN
jgi:hypothetical protein